MMIQYTFLVCLGNYFNVAIPNGKTVTCQSCSHETLCLHLSIENFILFTFVMHPLEPVVQRVREGGVANFTILRAGMANFITTVNYRFEYGDTSPGDFIPSSNDSTLVFDFGEWIKNISVAVTEDDIPETDEPFYIILFNATGLKCSMQSALI